MSRGSTPHSGRIVPESNRVARSTQRNDKGVRTDPVIGINSHPADLSSYCSYAFPSPPLHGADVPERAQVWFSWELRQLSSCVARLEVQKVQQLVDPDRCKIGRPGNSLRGFWNRPRRSHGEQNIARLEKKNLHALCPITICPTTTRCVASSPFEPWKARCAPDYTV